jgi:hypothetical protein
VSSGQRGSTQDDITSKTIKFAQAQKQVPHVGIKRKFIKYSFYMAGKRGGTTPRSLCIFGVIFGGFLGIFSVVFVRSLDLPPASIVVFVRSLDLPCVSVIVALVRSLHLPPASSSPSSGR